MASEHTISLPCVSNTYIFIVPERIPGVPAIIIVDIGHVVLVVDAHRLLTTSVFVVVIVDVDILKCIKTGADLRAYFFANASW